MKRFLYLFQVEHDLPENLKGAEGPDSDVRFLTYRVKSTDTRSIHYPWSSWTQGRNRLLREVVGGEWLYYVFCDADVRLEITGRGAERRSRRQSPWRAFEEFLLAHEPAVGTPAYSWQLSGQWDAKHETQTLRFFDPLLNAVHAEALQSLLPYYDLLDEQCADYSGSIVSSIAADLYPGHVLQTNRVQVLNPFSLRGYSERLMTKPETLYLQSLQDPRDCEMYLRQPEWSQLRHPGMGAPLRKTASYRRTEAELAARYRLDHPIWVRKRELLEMPRSHEFYCDDPESGRARRWRESSPASGPVPTGGLSEFRFRSHALRSRLGLVRTSKVFVLLRRILRARHELRILWRRWICRVRRPNARTLWRVWARSGGRSLKFVAGRPDAIDMIGYAMDRLRTPNVIFVEVGTGQGEVLGRLQDGVTQCKPVISIGVDPVQTRGFTWYTGFVLGDISPGLMSLSTILKQYGLDGQVLHWVRIAEGDPVAAFRTLGDQAMMCLFLTIRCPGTVSSSTDSAGTVGPDILANFEAAGFRAVAITACAESSDIEATFMNEALARTLLPQLAP